MQSWAELWWAVLGAGEDVVPSSVVRAERFLPPGGSGGGEGLEEVRVAVEGASADDDVEVMRAVVLALGELGELGDLMGRAERQPVPSAFSSR